MGPIATIALAALGVNPYALSPSSLPVNRLIGNMSPDNGETPRPSRESSTGTQVRAGFIVDLDNNAELRGPLWYGKPGTLGVAGKMLRDPHVRESIEYIAGPLCAARWKFKPVSADPLDREVASFLDWAIFEQLPWDQTLRRIVQRYSAYGFSIEEITDDYRAIPKNRFPLHPGGGSGIVPTGFHEIPASTVWRWIQSPTNSASLAGIHQLVLGSDGERNGIREISSDRFMRLTYDQEGANFPGMAVLRSAYGPWKLKMAFQGFEAIKHERTSVATPEIDLSEEATDEDIAAAKTILAEMRANEHGYLVLPHGYTFKWAGSGETNASNISLAIERCNKDIAINVSCGYMLLGLTGVTGSHALGSTQQTAHHLKVSSQAKFVSSGLSAGYDGWSVAQRLVRLNYGADVAVPRAIAQNLPTRPWTEIVKAFTNGVQVGAFTADDATEDELRESMEIGPRDPATARTIPSQQVKPIGGDNGAPPDAAASDESAAGADAGQADQTNQEPQDAGMVG